MKCCLKPKFKLEKSDILHKIVSNGYGKTETSIQKYVIFCENCGKLKEQGQL